MRNPGIRLETMRELAQAGSVREAVVLANGSKWSVLLRTGMQERPMVTGRGHVREFGSLTTAVSTLRRIGIGRCTVDSANYSEQATRQRPLLRGSEGLGSHPLGSQ